MVCKTPPRGFISFGKMMLNALKDTRDDDKWFARHPSLGLLQFGKMVLNHLKDEDDDKWFARHPPLGFI